MEKRSRPGGLAASIVVVVAGVGVALVPTLYTVYPEWTHVHSVRRTLAVIAWALCVAVVGVAAARRDLFVETVARAVIQVPHKVADRREEAYYSIIDTFLAPATHGLWDGLAFKVFRPVSIDSRPCLVPLNEPDHRSWQRWEIGHGAVGLAWEQAYEDIYVLLYGDRLHDERLGLSEQQLEAYGHLTLVAACVMHDENGQPIAVLGASSFDHDAHKLFLEGNGPSVQRELADDLGVLLADLFLGDPLPSGP
jgi:hypothetical protein